MLPSIFFVFILVAILMFWLSAKQRQKSGLPGGRIISSDTSQWNAVAKSLYAPGLGLAGKPDYVLEQPGMIIPVEVKTSNDPDRGPYDSHIYQLAAYCLLISHVYGKRPSHGILHYTSPTHKQRTYMIPFTQRLEAEIINLIQEIQQKPLRLETDRSHQSVKRCAQCGFRPICDQSLA
jgi:CRISPR-associated exonuclease Cas4